MDHTEQAYKSKLRLSSQNHRQAAPQRAERLHEEPLSGAKEAALTRQGPACWAPQTGSPRRGCGQGRWQCEQRRCRGAHKEHSGAAAAVLMAEEGKSALTET